MDRQLYIENKGLTEIVADTKSRPAGWQLHCSLGQMSRSTIGLGGNLAKDGR